ncbi:MAG: MazG nucleotide pyrophosphohydrolase domain-containing protein [Planctomycetota bacterium]
MVRGGGRRVSSRALRGDDRQNLEEEFADVFAWLVTLASIKGVDLAAASQKYAQGCPRCSATPCACRRRERQEEA